MQNKDEITQAILDQLPEEIRVSFGNINEAMIYFWMNIRSNGGLRLTKNGYEVLTKLLKMPTYSVDIDPKHVTKRTILQLDRQLTAPYYISTRVSGNPKLIFFSSREAMMASLYGDVRSFLGIK